MVSPAIFLIIQLLPLFVDAENIQCLQSFGDEEQVQTCEDRNRCAYSKNVKSGAEWQGCWVVPAEKHKYFDHCVKHEDQYEYICTAGNSCNTRTHCTNWIDVDQFDEYIKNGGRGGGGGGGAGGPPGGGGAGGPPGESKPKNGGGSINPAKFVISAIIINVYLLLC